MRVFPTVFGLIYGMVSLWVSVDWPAAVHLWCCDALVGHLWWCDALVGHLSCSGCGCCCLSVDLLNFIWTFSSGLTWHCFFTMQTLDMISRRCLYVAVAHNLLTPPFNLLPHNGLCLKICSGAVLFRYAIQFSARLQFPILGRSVEEGRQLFQLKYWWDELESQLPTLLYKICCIYFQWQNSQSHLWTRGSV